MASQRAVGLRLDHPGGGGDALFVGDGVAQRLAAGVAEAEERVVAGNAHPVVRVGRRMGMATHIDGLAVLVSDTGLAVPGAVVEVGVVVGHLVGGARSAQPVDGHAAVGGAGAGVVACGRRGGLRHRPVPGGMGMRLAVARLHRVLHQLVVDGDVAGSGHRLGAGGQQQPELVAGAQARGQQRPAGGDLGDRHAGLADGDDELASKSLLGEACKQVAGEGAEADGEGLVAVVGGAVVNGGDRDVGGGRARRYGHRCAERFAVGTGDRVVGAGRGRARGDLHRNGHVLAERRAERHRHLDRRPLVHLRGPPQAQLGFFIGEDRDNGFVRSDG